MPNHEPNGEGSEVGAAVSRQDTPLQPKWQKPPIEKDLDELPGQAELLGIPEEELVREYTAAFERAELQELNDADWNSMRNCDSARQDWTVAEIIDHRGGERDISGLEAHFRAGETMHAPVVLFREGEKPWLIGGNSRLMLCRALGIRPTILAVHLEN